MDLRTALRIVSTPATFDGTSDREARDYANRGLGGAGTASAVPVLDGGHQLRPVDMLLDLAYATRLSYDRSVLDVYMQWALARYIGVFDHAAGPRGSQPQLELSEAGRRVVDNQRRVLSEDLGIGMASHLARTWVDDAFGARAVSLIDLDNAVAAGLVPQPIGRRTDYLAVEVDAAAAEIRVLGLVEAKGTNRPRYSYDQVYTGARQIASTWQAGFPAVPGLVVATCSGRDAMRYVAARVDPPAGSGSAAPIPVTERLGREILGGTWAKLADIAEDDALYENVSPTTGRSRRSSASRPTSGRVANQVGDRWYEGTQALIPLPGGELRVFLGADADVLSALRQQTPDLETAAEALVTSAQSSRHRTELHSGSASPSDELVEATTEDGAALVLEAR